MKKAIRIAALIMVLIGVMQIFTVDSLAAKKARYLYYDFGSWRRYLSYDEPNCKHYNLGYRYVEDDYHSIYCTDCGIIFGYEKCAINNDYYSSPSDYYHDRCLTCLHKKEYVYSAPTVDTSGREYID